MEEAGTKLRVRLSSGLEVHVIVNIEFDSVRELKEKIGS